MKNKYQDAISNNQVEDFLLGVGQYHIQNRDWGGHDFNGSWFDIMEYGLVDINAYSILDQALINLFNTNDANKAFFVSVLFLSNYFVNKYQEKKISQEWDISKRLISLVKEGIKVLPSVKQIDQEKIQGCINVLKLHKIL